MEEKLVHLSDHKKARVHYRGLAKQFKRPELTRELEPVTAKERQLHANLGDDMVWYTSRYSGPGDSFREVKTFELRSFGLSPELLIYRVLKELFGPADLITVAFPKKSLEGGKSPELNTNVVPLEWSFMLQGNSEAFIEVRKEPGTQQPHLAIWVPKLQDANATNLQEKLQTINAEVKLFMEELGKTLKSSQHLIDPKGIKKSATSLGPINVYADMLAAGDEQLAAVSNLSARYKNKISNSKGMGATTYGTFYLAAAVNYLLALEAFVNLLIELLRKSEFHAEVFDRATTKADFELRVLSISLYCSGFSRVPFPPDSVPFKHVKRLRAFRNNLLHGNLSRDDHVLYLVPEDYFIFHWWPAVDGREKQSAFEDLPVARALFMKSHAQTVRKLVEEIVVAIIDALDPGHRKWAKSWRKNLLVPAVLKDARWVPNLSSLKAYEKRKIR